ncbi:Ras family protein, putative [Ichthyophthirius multifiliis]|uniref:Ras family protein, putative n=1 Tax=Ichthyophthirius multifiliis TaxID=5932 RepID=G0R4P1_ICHMU|nr:Ras family protein, putative [Ichthyophthirius multifiliis]EGR27547.1 Ras family protein, putative [Ichthyophthirius multifiliis]|eukprot:XP_004024999.1 Ras family protein, putative [Ichthyophthirius multifiliis]
MNSYFYLFKYIVIGDTGVGKSCLVLQFTDGRVKERHDVTIGIEFAVKTVRVNQKNIKLQIWDTAGQENFKSITKSYYRSAIGAILVYDITKKESFQNISKWLQEIKTNGNKYIVFALIGNKKDKEENRQISKEEAESFAHQNNLLFFELTANNNESVNNAFIKISERIEQLIKNQQIQLGDLNQGVKIGSEYNESSSQQSYQSQQLATPLSSYKKEQSKSYCC